MWIHVVSPGKAHDVEFRSAIELYEQRFARVWPVTWEFLKPGSITDESESIVKRLASNDYVVVLDERGRDTSSESFASLLRERELEGVKRLVIVIGGAYGVTEEVRARANVLMRLSAMTLPHQLVRLMLVEQLYRAHSILAGGKYHHG